MIPKIIHYCWFGSKPLPKSAKKCIASWKKFFPDFEIKEWNESNFDINSCAYTREAAAQKKWAFVSDYARVKILYEYGGIYFDTDVEVIASFDDILEKGNFVGLECDDIEKIEESTNVKVNFGSGFGFSPKDNVLKEILDHYENLTFSYSNDGSSQETIVSIVTRFLSLYGFLPQNSMQIVNGINVYPSDFFDPYKPYSKELILTENTHSIHYYNASWFPIQLKMKRFLATLIGKKGMTLYHKLRGNRKTK